MPLPLLDEVKLLILQQGVPPELIAGVMEFSGDLRDLIRTGIECNVARTVQAKVEAARDLGQLALTSPETADEIKLMAAQLLAEAQEILNDSNEEDDDGPAPVPFRPPPPAAA